MGRAQETIKIVWFTAPVVGINMCSIMADTAFCKYYVPTLNCRGGIASIFNPSYSTRH